jgi:hypothetical protein
LIDPFVTNWGSVKENERDENINDDSRATQYGRL